MESVRNARRREPSGRERPPDHKGRSTTLDNTSLLALHRGKEGDVITFDWLTDAGTLVVLNGEVKGNAIPGDDVYRALLKVWLGDRPTSAGLKKALLGPTE
jgi:hypothetical protein